MNNVHRIDEFLKLMAGASKQGYDINVDVVYKNLIYLGVGDKKVDIGIHFDSWVEHFKNIPNIDVFVAENWKYFCQFVNSNYNKINIYSAIKLYIAVDREHISKGANQLFEFLAKENIPHISNIGKHVRFDDIVIRVDTLANANKIINFVNNNEYLKNGILPSSPFTVTDANVAITWDGYLSYHNVTANWISEYINWEKKNNNLNNVSYSRFYAFIEKRFDLLFNKGVGLQQYADNLAMIGVINGSYEPMVDKLLLNYYDVTQLLLISLNPTSKKEDTYKYVNKVTDERYQSEMIDKISKLRSCNISEINEIAYTEQQKAAMRLAFTYMYEKYGYDDTRMHFLKFMKNGNYDEITRYKGARRLMKESGITREIATKISEDWNLMNINLESTMECAFKDTYDRYDFYQVTSAVEYLFKYTDFSRITNRSGYRKKLRDELDHGEILLNVMEILTRSGYKVDKENVDEICAMYVDNFRKTIGKKRQ